MAVYRLSLLSFFILFLACSVTAAIDQQADHANQQHHPDQETNYSPEVKRDSMKKLRPHNPILIYHQSIRQPRYLSAIRAPGGGDLSAAAGYNIPRRLIRRNNNRMMLDQDEGQQQQQQPEQLLVKPNPFLVWNHQLLPNFYNKRQPLHLRRNQNKKRSDNPWLDVLEQSMSEDDEYLANEQQYEEDMIGDKLGFDLGEY